MYAAGAIAHSTESTAETKITLRLRFIFSGTLNLGQRFQASSFKNLQELVEQSGVHQAIGCQGFAAIDLKGATVKVGHFAARFFDDQHACRRVPGVEVELPKSVEASAGHAAEIQRGRTCPPHAMSPQGN